MSSGQSGWDDGGSRRDDGRPGREERPYRDGERSYRDGERPYRDGERSYRDGERSYRDGERSYRDGERPYRGEERPYRDADRSRWDGGRLYRDEGPSRRDGGRPGWDELSHPDAGKSDWGGPLYRDEAPPYRDERRPGRGGRRPYRDGGRSYRDGGRSRRDGGRSRRDGRPEPARYAASKVPLITAYFWIIKLLTTAMGEATSDYMVRAMNPVVAVLLGAAGFAVAILLQFQARRYMAWIYWLAVAMVAVFGTMAADVLHIKFHVAYAVSTVLFAIVLAGVFALWYRSEGTLSIHSIRTPRRELFYWATVLATFALGTATGDLTARTLQLGYLSSGILFTVAIAVPAVAHWRFGMNPILAFWIAYILTRPVGASYADYVAFPRSVGGLAVGHGPVAVFLTLLIVCFVGYLAVTRKDVEEQYGQPGPSGPPRRPRDGMGRDGELRPGARSAPRPGSSRAPQRGPRPDPRSAPGPSPRRASRPDPRSASRPDPRTDPRPDPRTAARPLPRPGPRSSPRQVGEPRPGARPAPRQAPPRPRRDGWDADPGPPPPEERFFPWGDR